MSQISNMDDMKRRIQSLEQENMRLSERAEDSQILAFISQVISQASSKDEMLNKTLEHISMLKNIPIVACCQLQSGVASIVQSYVSFEHRDLNQQSFSCSEPISEMTFWDAPEARLSPLILRCIPTAALLIPFSSQYLGLGFYLFITRDEESNDFEYLALTLERMTDLLTLSLENRSLLKSYRMLNEKLERKVQKRTQSLRDTQEKYQSLVDGADVSIMLYNMTSFIEANPAALSMFHCSREQFFKLSPAELSPEYQENDVLSKNLAATYIEQAIEGGHAHFDWFHQRYQGEVFPSEVHLNRVILKGQTLVQAVIVDLSERLQVQYQLEKSEHRYRSIIENIQDFLYRTNVDGTVTFVAPSVEHLLGFSADDLVGKKIQEFYVQPRQREELLRQLHASSDGRVEGIQVELRHKQGHSVWLSNHVHMIYDEAGVFVGVEGIARDLTDLKKMEMQFYQAQKMESLGTLVGGIAHDFNNMLAGMTGTLYLMKAKLGGQNELLKRVDDMETQAFRASDMIKQLLSFARKGEVNLQKLSLSSLFKEVAKLLRQTTPENIELHLDGVDEGLEIHGDPSLLQQIWMNLVNNARDALSDTTSPEIHISLKKCAVDTEIMKQHPYLEYEAELAKMTVSDNGTGISKEHQQKIFEPFFTTKDKGTGLGLAMIYGAVHSHDGWIDVESVLGQGTSFHVYIPLQIEDMTAVELDDENLIAHGHQEMILVVDDDKMIRDVSCELLKSLDYRVIQAEDGQKALALFEAYKDDISLILTDVVMPNMGGWEFAQLVWLQKPDLPIIFISGYAEKEPMTLSEALDYVIILKKPCAIEDLSQSIQKLLGSSQI